MPIFKQKPMLGQRVNWSYPLAKHLVGCWMVNEKSGNRVYDLSNNGNDGILKNSAHFVTDQMGAAIDCDGTNPDYIEIPASAAINDLMFSGGTCVLWFKADTIGTDPRIVSKSSDSQPVGPTFVLEEATKFGFRIEHTNSDNGAWLCDTPTIAAGQWVQVAVALRGNKENRTPNIWINGVLGSLTQTKALSFPALTDASHPLRLGTRGDLSTTRSLDGKIDSFMMFNEMLTNNDVSLLYRNSRGMFRISRRFIPPAPGSNAVMSKVDGNLTNNPLLRGLVA